ncbi:hypothetical protein ACLOJK_032205 [Asimina triloba]
MNIGEEEKAPAIADDTSTMARAVDENLKKVVADNGGGASTTSNGENHVVVAASNLICAGGKDKAKDPFATIVAGGQGV